MQTFSYSRHDFRRLSKISASFSKAGAKVLLFFELTKYFAKKMQKKCTTLFKRVYHNRFTHDLTVIPHIEPVL